MKQKILFVATIYETNPIIVPALLEQKYKNWELMLIHDGPARVFNYRKMLDYYNDLRINFIETPERKQNFGHPNKTWALEQIKEGKAGQGCEFLVIGNSDNYYVPGFCDKMLAGFDDNTLATYCAEMSHNYIHWSTMQCALERGRIDIGQIMWRTQPAAELGWGDSVDHSADWFFIERFMQAHHKCTIRQVNGMLFVHN